MFPASFWVFLAPLLASLYLIWCASATPLHPYLLLNRDTRSDNILQTHAGNLLNTADLIKQSTEGLRTDYCEKLGLDENMRLVRPERVPAPLSNFYEARWTALSDREIVRLYVSDLTTYKQVLTEIIRMEGASSVKDRMKEIVENVRLLIERLIEVDTYINQLPENYQAASSTQSPPLALSTQNSTRVLYVLQEFNEFMAEVWRACHVFFDRHKDD